MRLRFRPPVLRGWRDAVREYVDRAEVGLGSDPDSKDEDWGQVQPGAGCPPKLTAMPRRRMCQGDQLGSGGGQEVLAAAVVYERARGTSWTDIGQGWYDNVA